MKGIQEREYQLLMAGLPDTPAGRRDRGLFDLMFDGGLRLSEAREFQPDDYEPRGGDNPHLWVRRGKGDKERHVAISVDHGRRIEAWIESSDRPVGEGFALYPILRQGPHLGQPVQGTQLRETLAHLSRKAGIFMRDRDGNKKPVSPHKLRHTHAHRLILRGVTLAEVKRQLGHANIATTQIYLEVDDQVSAGRIRTALDGRHVDDTTQRGREAARDLRLAGGELDGAAGVGLRTALNLVRELGSEEAIRRLVSSDLGSSDLDEIA